MGYRLEDLADVPISYEIAKKLDTLFLGKQGILYRQTLDSTQDIAVYLAQHDEDSHGRVVIAEQQRNGRGRQRRRWLSPRGGIWLSAVLKPHMSLSRITLLPFAAALAVRDAIKKCTPLDPKLNWPNDIIISGKKVAGVLIDSSLDNEQINYAVIGIGINVNVDSAAIASYLGNSDPITSISDELGHNASLLGLTTRLLETLEYYYFQLERRGPNVILEKWKKESDILHRRVIVAQKDRTIQGIAEDINTDGSLFIRTDRHGSITVVADDVHLSF
jgi:BirA family biotin operon repressor/biotin-[acetyl-CoA-carboxylase] ligase